MGLGLACRVCDTMKDPHVKDESRYCVTHQLSK
jgi:hypothetical protein